MLNKTSLSNFPPFFKNIFNFWSKCFSALSHVDSCILSQNVWYNSYIKINNTTTFIQEFSEKNINFVYQLFDNFGYLKSWDDFKTEFDLNQKLYFKWLQICHAVPKNWKQLIKGNEIFNNILLLDHHLITENRLVNIQKLSPKELYNIMVFLNPTIPTSQNYYNIKFNDHNLDWKSIYLLPRKVTLDSHTRIFQYKILNNILYLNEKLFKFGISSSSLCSFCNTSDETPEHLFSLCTHTLTLWSQLQVA